MENENHKDSEVNDQVVKNETDNKDMESAPKEPQEPQQSGITRFLGIFLTAAAALQFSLSALIIKILNYHPFNLGVWRFGAMSFFPMLFIIYKFFSKKENVFKGLWPPGRTTAFLILQAIIGSNSILLAFFGFKYLSIADTTVISTSASIFVTFVAFVLLGEKLGVVPILTAMLAVIGVWIISKPSIITGAEGINEEIIIGIFLSVCSMVLLTIHYVILRYIRAVHHTLVTLSFAIWGLIECVVVSFAIGVLEAPKTLEEVGLLLATAALAFSAVTCLTLALKYEQAGPVALVRTIEVVFAFLWQYIFLDVQPGMLSGIGAAMVLVGVFITSGRKIVISLPKDHKCKKIFAFLML
ncbi:unnamed protein product [Orchesella dallaii]|uniref:EamA domain-containing protein n=1 Tax=Orchesella dallaii TaxID=48710 RepID=A0ABP1S6A7_9HEXA